MAPSHGFAAASHREAALRGVRLPWRDTFGGAAGFREAAAAVRPAATAPSQTAKSLPLAPAGTASNFACAGKKTATLYRVTAPADPVLVHGNRLGGAKGRSRSPFDTTRRHASAAVKCRTAAVDGRYAMVAV